MKNVILIASHKKYDMPDSGLYLPLQVGASGKESIGFTRDDNGDNISQLNSNFCELTGLYWAWKNLEADAIGLVHYRRYLSGKERFKVGGKTKKILSDSELEKLFLKTDIVLPVKRNYFIETLYSHYAHTMYVEPLDETGKIIEEFYPKYFVEFQRLKKRKGGHMFNMFVMKRDKCDEYCTWLFDILFKLQERIDISQYDDFHARLFGRVSELLLDVWINTNEYRYIEVDVTYTENVNWIKKGIKFLKAKFGHKKYND